MSVRRSIPEYNGIYFITFTCSNWLNLFAIANAYQAVYDWFDYLRRNGHFIVGYVIMPNHVHSLIAFRNTKGKSINKIIGNGKRFIAYDIIKRLKLLKYKNLLSQLSHAVNKTERTRQKIHQVFEPSFDWKECLSDKFIEQKLNYIHNNPCAGKWNLAIRQEDYIHSSAKFYFTGVQGYYEVTAWADVKNIDLTSE